jgi:hypothetical protein
VGRKTDVRDCEWLANLLCHGLLRGSFVPDRSQQELRELTRYRTGLVQERSAEVNRLQKTLEGANIKLGDVAIDIMGLSSRQMLAALAGGETDAAAMAKFDQSRPRDKLSALERALAGRTGPHQRFLLTRQLAHIDFLDTAIVAGSLESAARLRARILPRRDDAARGCGTLVHRGASPGGSGVTRTHSREASPLSRTITVNTLGQTGLIEHRSVARHG